MPRKFTDKDIRKLFCKYVHTSNDRWIKEAMPLTQGALYRNYYKDDMYKRRMAKDLAIYFAVDCHEKYGVAYFSGDYVISLLSDNDLCSIGAAFFNRVQKR